MAEQGYSRDTIDEKFKATDEKIKVANHRIDDLEVGMKETQQLVAAMATIDKKVDILSAEVSHTFVDIKKDISATAEDIKQIKDKPVKMAEKLAWLVVGSVISGAVSVIVWLIQR